jgi:hypothetical protein
MTSRINVNRKTVIGLKAGDPSTTFGTYLSSAWVMGLEASLLSAFSPENDPQATRLARFTLPHRVRAENSSDADFTDISLDF